MVANDNIEIVRLYTDEYFSMKQIADLKNCSIGTVRNVLDKHQVTRRKRSEAIRYLNLTKYNKGGFTIKENLSIEEEKLKVAGVMLYWGEGTKSGNVVTLSNSNPVMVQIFLRFLRNICGISEDRLRVLLHIYNDQNEQELKMFWSDHTNIPLKQFSNSYVHTHRSGTYKKISKYGTASLRYADTELLKIINKWIEKYSRTMVH